MEPIFQIYENKLCKSGLTDAGAPLLGFRDARLVWNMDHGACAELEKVFEHLNINALLFSRPAEPYWHIINYLANTSGNVIFPEDCETRTFLHDLPISRQFTSEAIVSILKKRKSVIIPEIGIVTQGTVSLEQAFVTFSSICFACFVKFFHDTLSRLKKGKSDRRRQQVFDRVVKALDPPICFDGLLMKGPFSSETEVVAAIQEAGKLTVDHRLVDSYFGNISLRYEDTLFISQTGSSLGNLKGCIDPCPMDGSSCVAITASSELPAHLHIVKNTEYNAILHGHPKFSVILSMDCDIENCECSGKCHINCPHERSVCNIPVVSGEVGSGPHGLFKTVPGAIENNPGVIVYGHGLFTAGVEDFNRPFRDLLEIENRCREEYFNRIDRLR
ncbi:class II aldolase/adducin family protein [Thermodesulfobacteriota bacterium]